MQADVPIKTVKYTGKDPLGYVLSANLHRRHLNESQRAMVAAKLANMQREDTLKQGSRSANLQNGAMSQSDAADRLHVSPRSVADASKVRSTGTARLVDRVEAGEIAVSVAAKIADLPAAQQEQLASADEATLRNASKKTSRAARASELAEATRAASAAIGSSVYGVI